MGTHTLALSADWHLPATMHLRFAPGSSLQIAGGVLHFDNATIDAPPDSAIFPNPDHVRDLADARPEWFLPAGQASNPVPASALAEAYEATVPWGTIYLRNREYISPFTSCPGYAVPFNSPRNFVGLGRPIPDDPSAPSRLHGGTTLLGGIYGTAALRMAHLGVDAGPQVAAHILHGCEPPGIFIVKPGRTFLSGDRLDDVSVLTTGALNMHTVIFEGHRNIEIKGLWVWTLGGTHGLIIKSSDTVVSGFHCWGARSDCLLIKSDYATSLMGRAVHNRISHVEIAPLRPGEAVGGIAVDARWDTVRDLEMDDIHQIGSGIALAGSALYVPDSVTIRRWTADSAPGSCLLAYRTRNLIASGFQCNLLPGAQAGVVLHSSRSTHLLNGTVRCIGSSAQCNATVTDGVLNDATGTSLDGFIAQSLRGFLVRNAKDPASLSGSQAAGMDGRLTTQYRIPFYAHWHDFTSQTKPILRILYTTVASRVSATHNGYAFWSLLAAPAIYFSLRFRRRKTAPAKYLRDA